MADNDDFEDDFEEEGGKDERFSFDEIEDDVLMFDEEGNPLTPITSEMPKKANVKKANVMANLRSQENNASQEAVVQEAHTKKKSSPLDFFSTKPSKISFDIDVTMVSPKMIGICLEEGLSEEDVCEYLEGICMLNKDVFVKALLDHIKGEK